jgi:hypothetical protein
MNKLIIKEYLSILDEKLFNIESLLNKQIEEIQAFRSNNPSANHEDLLIAQQKATRTTFEILRDEIDEFSLISTSKYQKEKDVEEEIVESFY